MMVPCVEIVRIWLIDIHAVRVALQSHIPGAHQMTTSASSAMPIRAFSSADELNEKADFYVRFLDTLHRQPNYQANHKRTIELLEICEGYQLLDVGCGVGSYS